jgi:hypothetical protein
MKIRIKLNSVGVWWYATTILVIIWISTHIFVGMFINHLSNKYKAAAALVAKHEATISQLEYDMLNCRMNTINEMMGVKEFSSPPTPIIRGH